MGAAKLGQCGHCRAVWKRRGRGGPVDCCLSFPVPKSSKALLKTVKDLLALPEVGSTQAWGGRTEDAEAILMVQAQDTS